MRILALEASTTSAKAMLYDTKSRTYEEKIKAYGKMYDEEVLHDADKVFDCMAKIGRELAGGREISIISCSATVGCGRRHRSIPGPIPVRPRFAAGLGKMPVLWKTITRRQAAW